MFAAVAGIELVSLPAPSQSEDVFDILAPFVGSTWVGMFESDGDGQPGRDVSRWDWALNGKAVRILHSLNDGAYGGETLVFWDVAAEKLVFHYFTTAGFMTKGTMYRDGEYLVSHETVTGNTEGITEVKSTSRLMDDGSMKGTSMYLKDGVWTEGHSAVYRKDESAKIL